jgi:SAM-dependent methyltransferase
VVGVDLAPRMVEAARASAQREGLAVTFRVQSVTELDEPPDSFDGAYWAGSYHHIPGRSLRIETLRRIVRALTPDGVLVLMVVYRGERGLVSRSRLVDLFRNVLWRIAGPRWLSEAGDGYMREISEASDPQEQVFFHDFSGPGEIRDEIEAAGFTAEEVSPGWWICRRSPAR